MVAMTNNLRIARAFRPDSVRSEVMLRQGQAGTSSGVNIAPGSDDDGWVVPKPVKLHDGTRIQLYKDGEALHAAYEAIRQARHQICLEVYIFASDSTGRAFADLLCAKAMEGVRVYVIYDSAGSLQADRDMFEKMRRAGVCLEEFHPVWPWRCQYSWRPFNRDHRKLLVIDQHVGGMGGLNIGREYAGSWVVPSAADGPEPWRDNAVGLAGPSARLLLHAFAHSWQYITRGGRVRRGELIHNIALEPRAPDYGLRVPPAIAAAPITPGADVALLASVPTLASPLAAFLKQLIRGARTSIQLTTAYFAPSDGLIDELCDAVKRGVRVQLMLPGRCDHQLLLVAARSFYERLLSAGVEIAERQEVILHTKTLVIDEETTVLGSTNLDYRSIEYNFELSLAIRSGEFGRQMHGLFEHDRRFARPISLKEWRRRPTLDRVVQWAVNRSRYLL